MFALILAPEELDRAKIISMLRIHNIVEIDPEDAPIHDRRDEIEEGVANSPGDACADVGAPERVRRLLTAYAAFAERHPAQYQLLLGARPEAGARLSEPRYHERLWAQTLSIVEPLVGADDAPACNGWAVELAAMAVGHCAGPGCSAARSRLT